MSFSFDPADVCSPEWLISETDVVDSERDTLMSWATCEECGYPDMRIDHVDGLCYPCQRRLCED
jgi:hypothetical protein